MRNLWPLFLSIFLLMPTVLSTMKIGVIGGGNWGTTMARHLARGNETEVTMWVKDESVGEESLCEIINRTHQNSKYLPGVDLPHNLRACAEIDEVCKANEVLFVGIPHQFVESTLKDMAPYVAKGTIVVSLVKGMMIKENGPELISDMIANILDLRTEVAVLMGANVASDVARDDFVEASIACKDDTIAATVKSLVHTHTFHIDLVTSDVPTVEMMGAIKNVIAIGAGLCDGLEVGVSTKAAIIRRGLAEMVAFCELFSRNSDKAKVSAETLLASCGVADVIATCFGGRNRKCAEEWCRKRLSRSTSTPDDSEHISPAAAVSLWQQVETELLNGQKLQGLGTCHEMVTCLQHKKEDGNGDGNIPQFPLFERIYDIVFNGASPSSLIE